MGKVFLILALIILVVPTDVRAVSTEQTVIHTDAQWKVSEEEEPNWYAHDFNDSSWLTPELKSMGKCRYRKQSIYTSEPMWHPDPHEHQVAYFRRTFTIDNPIHSAEVIVNFDDDGDVYINGQIVFEDRSRTTEKVNYLLDIAPYLVQGENTLALRVDDVKGGCQWALATIYVKTYAEAVLDVPLFKQTDARWASDEYDHSESQSLWCGKLLEECGCVTTSLAMLLQYYGYDINPAGLNDYFKKDTQCTVSGCVSRGYVFGDVRWTALHSYTAENYQSQNADKLQYVSVDSFDIETVKQDIEDGAPVVLKAANRSHWFLGIGSRDKNIRIHDPFYDIVSLSDPYYGGEAKAMRRYKVVHSDFSAIEVYAKDGGDIRITDMYGRRAGANQNNDSVEIPRSSYSIEEPIDNPVATETHTRQGTRALIISQPEKGTYAIESSTPMVLYISDKNAQETIHMPKTASGKVVFTPDDINMSSFKEGADLINFSQMSCIVP